MTNVYPDPPYKPKIHVVVYVAMDEVPEPMTYEAHIRFDGIGAITDFYGATRSEAFDKAEMFLADQMEKYGKYPESREEHRQRVIAAYHEKQKAKAVAANAARQAKKKGTTA